MLIVIVLLGVFVQVNHQNELQEGVQVGCRS